jgi:hypothetical protein
MTVEDVREQALALADTTEEPHWGNPSFRTRGRIFATVPDPQHLNVFVDVMEVDGIVRRNPESCAELWWGKELRGVRVELPDADPRLVGELLQSAWRRRAKKRTLSR